ncbi:MAG: ABC-ATPase domain-containing protein, partial [Halorhodospira sp.]
MEQLQATLQRIDGRGYKAYKDIEGRHAFPGFTLMVDKVQADPFAA